MNQGLSVRQGCKKYLSKGNDVFFCICALGKANDVIDRHGM